jgi:hypothetical protein
VSDESKDAKTDPQTELKAMGKIADAVEGLDAETMARVLRWAAERYNVTLSGSRSKTSTGAATGSADNGGSNGGNGAQQFGDLADLYAATSPEPETDKALVAGYWFQFCEGRPEFGAQEVNTALKNLGHSIKNITSAFDNLKARKPSYVMQLKKAGTTKQARKTYKLTVAGKQAVELMIGQH